MRSSEEVPAMATPNRILSIPASLTAFSLHLQRHEYMNMVPRELSKPETVTEVRKRQPVKPLRGRERPSKQLCVVVNKPMTTPMIAKVLVQNIRSDLASQSLRLYVSNDQRVIRHKLASTPKSTSLHLVEHLM